MRSGSWIKVPTLQHESHLSGPHCLLDIIKLLGPVVKASPPCSSHLHLFLHLLPPQALFTVSSLEDGFHATDPEL